jgi:hypothetical protein
MNFRNLLLFLVGCSSFAFKMLPTTEPVSKLELANGKYEVIDLCNDESLKNNGLAEFYTKKSAEESVQTSNEVDCPSFLPFNQLGDINLNGVVANCKDTEIFLDGDGLASIDTTMVNNGSSCSCPSLSFSLDVTDFDCVDLGLNLVVLTVDDGQVQDTCHAMVTVSDNLPPFFQCQQETYFVNAGGIAELDPNDFVFGIFENCSVEFSLSQDTFYCSNLGTNSVIVTGEDQSGLSSTCSTSVLIKDGIPPTADCIDTVFVSLAADGLYTLSPSDVDDGSSDNCSIISYSLSIYELDCADLGISTQTMSVSDNSIPVNSANCNFILNVSNGSVPDMQCSDLSVSLDASGSISILPESIDAGSEIACGSFQLSLDIDAFDCLNLGTNNVTLTGVGDMGGTDFCNAVVMIEDTDAPIIDCLSNLDLELSSSGNVLLTPMELLSSISDNCTTSPTLSIDQSSFDCTDEGNTIQVELIAIDDSNNSSSCNTNVTILDNTGPEFNCNNTTITLTSELPEVLETSTLITGMSDNCNSNPIISPVSFEFTCAEQGMNELEIFATDISGNTTVCSLQVTVNYNDFPEAICVSELSVELDDNGEESISVLQVDGGSTVLCETPFLELNQDIFTCADLGTSQLSLFVSNANGDIDICTTTLTVVDATAPEVVCKDALLVVNLDEAGTVSGSYQEFIISTFDNCGAVDLVEDTYNFDCTDLGFNLVEVLVEDESGNMNSCNAFVEVFDEVAPDAVCNAATVELGLIGTATIGADELTQNSTDNCSVKASFVEFSFSCSDIGPAVPVEVVVSDANGNSSICTAMVTVVDLISPVASCQTTEIFVNADNVAVLDAESINNSSFDNCSSLSYSVSPSTFNCSDLGSNNSVVLTVSDESGNWDECSIDITISDNSNPIPECFTLSEVALEDDGNLELELIDIFSGNSFSCVGFSYEISPNIFDCTHVGSTQTVTLTITGQNGSSSQVDCAVQILDETPPVFECQDLNVTLTDNSDYVIYPEMLDGDSYDVCTGDLIYYNFDSLILNCDNIGATEIELIIVDANLSFDTCMVSVIIDNQTQPNAICKAIHEVNLDENGNASITIDDINNGSSDLCGNILPSTSAILNQTEFNCSDILTSPNVVVLSIIDTYGNEDECESLINVYDQIEPTILSYKDTISLIIDGEDAILSSGNFEVEGADNCGINGVLIRRLPNSCDNSQEFDSGVTFCGNEADGIYELDLRLIDQSSNFVEIPVFVELKNTVGAKSIISPISKLIAKPNPFNSSTTMEITLTRFSPVYIQVFSMDGSLVVQKDLSLNAGVHEIPIDLEFYPAGPYFCEVITAEGSQTTRLIKLN